MGPKVCRAVLNFLNYGIFDPATNNTYVALIPKKKNPSCVSSVTDYRPISFCNVIFISCVQKY